MSAKKRRFARVRRWWTPYSARFLALKQRERAMLMAAVLCGIVYLGGVVWLAPLFESARTYARQAAERTEEIAGLEERIKALSEQMAQDPNAPLQHELSALERQIQGVEERLRPYGSAMVEPTRTVALLKELVQQTPGVRLEGFNNLPAVGLLASQRPEAKKGETPRTFENDVYKHGFEIRLRGNYLALLAYLRTLEAQPERLFWQRARLEVAEYPESELTLTIYTLSLDRHWLEL
ncbi:MAG: hypothetical protein LBP86_11060 [Azoarcus sp.]|jgi:MSHA biogenesis protein MshJ|nr:hypothetical protein [Azoarcus sp.]